MADRAFVLGVDAGGTKTLAAVADVAGTVHGVGQAGAANFQGCGLAGAAGQMRRAVELATAEAGIALDGLRAACYGVSGADRPVDFASLGPIVESITPVPRLRLENDTLVALRAGTVDGVGVALIAGTGSNAIGRAADGRTLQVGGLGRLTGDAGSAGQLAEAAVVAAFRGLDGRGPATTLSQRIPERLGLAQLADIIEFDFYDQPRGPLDLGSLAPVVFAEALAGDAVAEGILIQAGREVARAVEVILDGLFPPPGPVSVVFGGSVFMHGISPRLIETVEAQVLRLRPAARFVRLAVQPVLGAVAFALDDAIGPIGPEVFERLATSFAARCSQRAESTP